MEKVVEPTGTVFVPYIEGLCWLLVHGYQKLILPSNLCQVPRSEDGNNYFEAKIKKLNQ